MELVPRDSNRACISIKETRLTTLHEEPEKREKDPEQGQPDCRRRKSWSNNPDETTTVILSAFYGKLLVVLGLALPVTAAIIPGASATTYDGFYLYLYLGSLLFLCYMYAGVMKEEVVLSVSRKTSAFEMSNKRMTGAGTNPEQQIQYGSFYLRMGVAGFGVGAMIHAVLHFGMYFELKNTDKCNDFLVAVTPLAQAAFIIMQMIFIFSDNSKLLDEYSYRELARFGLMHMIATNVCEWLYVVVEETKYDMMKVLNSTVISVVINETGDVARAYVPDISPDCWQSDIMAPLVRSASRFLFPCTVEYSLLCAVILGVMWLNACSDASRTHQTTPITPDARQSGVNIIYSRSVSQFSVDCTNAHKGLFAGILVLVLSIVSLILFFELVRRPEFVDEAVLQVNIWETVLYASATVAAVACIISVRNVGLIRGGRRLELEHILLFVTQGGLFLFILFQMVAAYFSLDEGPRWSTMRIVTLMSALVQSMAQTILVLDAWKRRCNTKEQMARKPGKQLITFLLITNFAMWVVNRLKNNRPEFYPLQVEFYGEWAWTIITHTSMPLVVCYRFQSSVCLYEIWKHVYKTKSEEDS
ncbi:proton channel OtopLc-like [Periplaneta americana]|uniref:proton channel OtopLc-like n=1 Tax=Periplaneta americana TaxID=6978 RepID=UPI0037E71A8B